MIKLENKYIHGAKKYDEINSFTLFPICFEYLLHIMVTLAPTVLELSSLRPSHNTVFGYFDHHCEPVLISLRDGHIAFVYPRLASSNYVLVGWAEGDISWSKSESLLGTSSTSATVTATNVSS